MAKSHELVVSGEYAGGPQAKFREDIEEGDVGWRWRCGGICEWREASDQSRHLSWE